MTANIIRLSGADAYDLIYPEFLSTLSAMNQETMHRSIMNSSQVWLGYDDDHILAFWGLIPPTFLSDRAYLWLYTTEHFHSHIFMFVRHSQRVVKEMLEEYPIIVGHGAVGADRSLRWLKWLGAEFIEAEPDGKLIRFEIRADKCQRQDSVQSA
jgi:hypothetical protein